MSKAPRRRKHTEQTVTERLEPDLMRGREMPDRPRRKKDPAFLAEQANAGKLRPLYLAYIRVSTSEQADSGLGLAAQRDRLRMEARLRDWDVKFFSDEGASGETINAGLREALEHLSMGRADGLIVTKMDRLARSSRHAAEIMDMAKDEMWNLVLLDMGLDLSTPQGRAMASMLATFAEFERELISSRTKDALAARKASGKKLGRPSKMPASILNRIITEREAGATFTRIAQRLTSEHILTPSGRRTWDESTVRRAYQSSVKRSEAVRLAKLRSQGIDPESVKGALVGEVQ